MSETLKFKTYCLESYKQAHKMSGKQAVELFRDYGVLNYIDSFFDILHSTGQRYIVEDIDLFIKARQ
jgi:hypothetical protein